MLSNKRTTRFDEDDDNRSQTWSQKSNISAKHTKSIEKARKAPREREQEQETKPALPSRVRVLSQSLFAPETETSEPESDYAAAQAPGFAGTRQAAVAAPVTGGAGARSRVRAKTIDKNVLLAIPVSQRLFAQQPSLSATQPHNQDVRVQPDAHALTMETLQAYSDNPVMTNRFFQSAIVQHLQERGQLRGRWANNERAQGLLPRLKEEWWGRAAKDGKGGKYTWGHPCDDVEFIKQAVQFRRRLQHIAEEQQWRRSHGRSAADVSVPRRAPLTVPPTRTAGGVGFAAPKPRDQASSTLIHTPLRHTAPPPAPASTQQRARPQASDAAHGQQRQQPARAAAGDARAQTQQPGVAATQPQQQQRKRQQPQQQRASTQARAPAAARPQVQAHGDRASTWNADNSVPMALPTLARAPQFHHDHTLSRFRAQKALRTALFFSNHAARRCDAAVEQGKQRLSQHAFEDVHLSPAVAFMRGRAAAAAGMPLSRGTGEGAHQQSTQQHRPSLFSAPLPIPGHTEFPTMSEAHRRGQPSRRPSQGHKGVVHVQGVGFTPIFSQGRVEVPSASRPSARTSASTGAKRAPGGMGLSRISAGAATQLPHSVTQPSVRARAPDAGVPWIYSQDTIPAPRSQRVGMQMPSQLRHGALPFMPRDLASYAREAESQHELLSAAQALVDTGFVPQLVQLANVLNNLMQHTREHAYGYGYGYGFDAYGAPQQQQRHPSQRKASYYRWKEAPGGTARAYPVNTNCTPIEFAQAYQVPHAPPRSRRDSASDQISWLLQPQPCQRAQLHQTLQDRLNARILVRPRVRRGPSQPVNRQVAEFEGRRRGEHAPLHILHHEDDPIGVSRVEPAGMGGHAPALDKHAARDRAEEQKEKEHGRKAGRR